MTTEDVLHAPYGSTETRRQLTVNFLAYPSSDAQIHGLKGRTADSLRVPASFADSDEPRQRKMVQQVLELGFERDEAL